MAEESNDRLRIRYGTWLIGAAFALVGIVFGVAIWQYDDASEDVVAVIGGLTTFIGTVIGAFFGVQAGATGKEAVEMRVRELEKVCLGLASQLQPGQGKEYIDQL